MKRLSYIFITTLILAGAFLPQQVFGQLRLFDGSSTSYYTKEWDGSWGDPYQDIPTPNSNEPIRINFDDETEYINERSVDAERSKIIVFQISKNETPKDTSDDKITGVYTFTRNSQGEYIYDMANTPSSPDYAEVSTALNGAGSLDIKISSIVKKLIDKHNGVKSSSTESYPMAEASKVTTDLGTGKPQDWIKIGQCSFTSFSLDACALALGTLILNGMSYFLAMSGVILNFVIDKTIFEANTLLKDSTIQEVWRTVRNLCNLIFIFVLLDISIRTILGDAGRKKLIVPVIVAAIFINFSMLLTMLVIDLSNIITLKFYDAIITSVPTTEVSGKVVTGLSNAYMNNLQLSQIYAAAKVGTWEAMIMTFLGSIFFLIAAFVFFAFAIMLLVRFIIFVFLIALSPFAFVGSILPKVKELISARWFDNLIKQSIFAPAFMLMAWITLQISGGVLKNISTAEDYGFSLAFRFIIMICFMIGTLMVAISTGASGAGFAGKMAGKISFGTAGMLGRNTLGRYARYNARKGGNLEKMAKSPNFFKQTIGSALLKNARNTAKSSFDLRNTSGAQRLGSVLGLGKDGFGKATGKGGYEGAVNAAAKDKVAWAKSLNMNDTEKQAYANSMQNRTKIGGIQLSNVNEQAARQITNADEKEKKAKVNAAVTEKATQIKEREVKVLERYKEKTGYEVKKSQVATAKDKVEKAKLAFNTASGAVRGQAEADLKKAQDELEAQNNELLKINSNISNYQKKIKDRIKRKSEEIRKKGSKSDSQKLLEQIEKLQKNEGNK